MHERLIKLLLLPLTIILKQGYYNYPYRFKQGYTHMLGRAWVQFFLRVGVGLGYSALPKLWGVGLG